MKNHVKPSKPVLSDDWSEGLGSQMSHSRPKISFVIIARNEAAHIGRAIESILTEARWWPPSEILLVDSASTDDTVKIASQYPINIVRLDSAWFLSASAGRYIGMHYTQGELIMHLDGDMELVPGWLGRAVALIAKYPEVGGITGYRRDIHLQGEQVVDEGQQPSNPPEEWREVPYFAGAAIYRRTALEKVGGFNPYLISDEEPELCMRLRQAGYKLVYLPHLMCNNHTLPVNSWQYYKRRLQTGLLLGRGQTLRYHLGTPLFWTALKERSADILILVAGLMAMLTILLATIIFKNLWIFMAWIMVMGVVFLYFWIKKGSLGAVLLSLVGRSLNVYGIVHGFFLSPKSPGEYPLDVDIVKHNGHQSFERTLYHSKDIYPAV